MRSNSGGGPEVGGSGRACIIRRVVTNREPESPGFSIETAIVDIAGVVWFPCPPDQSVVGLSRSRRGSGMGGDASKTAGIPGPPRWPEPRRMRPGGRRSPQGIKARCSDISAWHSSRSRSAPPATRATSTSNARIARIRPRPSPRPRPRTTTRPPPPPPPAAAATGVDPHSFACWLNGQRAARGLAPCGVSGQLCQDAAANSSRGFGHTFFGTARRQNVGMGPPAVVYNQWTNSPGHAAALFDPSITAVGLAEVGGVITFAAN